VFGEAQEEQHQRVCEETLQGVQELEEFFKDSKGGNSLGRATFSYAQQDS
jgi:hypothetical protein